LVFFSSFCPLRNYSVNIGPIQSSLPTSILFGLIWSHSVYFVYFGPNLSICSYSVQFAPIRSTSVIFSPPCPFKPLQSILVHFDIFLCTFVMRKNMFGLKTPILNPNLLIYIYLYIYLKLVISKILSMVFVIATLLLSLVNVVFQFTLLQLNLITETFLNI